MSELMPGVEYTPLALLLLGQGSDPDSERGVECHGDMPPASDPAYVERRRAARAARGDNAYVPALNDTPASAHGFVTDTGSPLHPSRSGRLVQR